ncbi:hypothetical protein H6F89_34380 [Cyanobacteria bacterium FACHB-63]|nr:hypothetical protein [Cyanobacteria bacterium FACHB-63]
MLHSRRRIVLPISLQPFDQTVLEKARSRLDRYVPHLNRSEVVRIALAVVCIASPEVLQSSVSRVARVRSGRPPTRRASYASSEDEAIVREDEERLQRFALLRELQLLQMQSTRSPTQEKRLEEICAALGMVFVPSKIG